MSCFIMNSDSIRKIGYTLADILNGCIYSSTLTIAKIAACHADLVRAFSDCQRSGSYSGEMITEKLHQINARAYAGRYSETDLAPLAPRTNSRYSIQQCAKYEEHEERPQEWHYHLAQLIDCWLYQTDEDATRHDSIRLDMMEFSSKLALQIVQHSEQYNKNSWGE